MQTPWQAEQIVDQSTALKLINAQFPELKAAEIHLLGVGWDNTAYVINKELIFRFPRRAVAVSLLTHEFSALPKIAGQLPLEIPNPEWLGKPSDEFPWPFLGYRMLPGTTADQCNLSDNQREKYVKPLAQFLKALHAISKDGFASELPGDTIERLNVTVRIPRTLALMKDIEALGILPHKEIVHAIIEDSKNLPIPQEKVIVHGDLYARHLLLDDHRNLTGIIDWGDVHLNSPAADLAVVYNFLPPQFHAQFEHIYGPISQTTWMLARFRALIQCLNFIIYGHTSGDSIIKREGERGMNYIAATYNHTAR